jgi:hypothetical protein
VATVSGNIDKVHNKFDKNYSQLIARGATIDDPMGILFEAYLVVPCHNFKTYICCQHEDYLDGKLIAITHEALMTSAKCKCNWLKMKGLWRAKSPDNEKIVAMTAALNAKTRTATTRARRRRTRRIFSTSVNRKRMRLG